MSEVTLTVRLFGVADVIRDGQVVRLQGSCVALLAALLLRRGRPYPRPELAELLAGGQPEDGSRQRLNTALWRLRCALEPDGQPRHSVVVTDGTMVAINDTCSVWLDVEQFEAVLRTRVARPPRLWAPDDVTAVAAAVELYRGDLLAGGYDDWMLGARARLADLHLAGLVGLVRWYRAAGEVDRVTEYGERVLAQEPLREDVHRDLMAAYSAAGRHDLAVRQFKRCRRLLADELGVDPMPETQAMVARVTRGVGEPPASPVIDVAALVADLELARAEVTRLGALLDRSLAALRHKVGAGSGQEPGPGARPEAGPALRRRLGVVPDRVARGDGPVRAAATGRR